MIDLPCNKSKNCLPWPLTLMSERCMAFFIASVAMSSIVVVARGNTRSWLDTVVVVDTSTSRNDERASAIMKPECCSPVGVVTLTWFFSLSCAGVNFCWSNFRSAFVSKNPFRLSLTTKACELVTSCCVMSW